MLSLTTSTRSPFLLYPSWAFIPLRKVVLYFFLYGSFFVGLAVPLWMPLCDLRKVFQNCESFFTVFHLHYLIFWIYYHNAPFLVVLISLDSKSNRKGEFTIFSIVLILVYLLPKWVQRFCTADLDRNILLIYFHHSDSLIINFFSWLFWTTSHPTYNLIWGHHSLYLCLESDKNIAKLAK